MEANDFSTDRLENLVKELIDFCKKWGLWEDVQIFAGGKCYTDMYDSDVHMDSQIKYTKLDEDVYVRDEPDPDEYLTGFVSSYNTFTGQYDVEKACFSNPEHILDMTFEGPLYQLLRYSELEVKVENLSDEAKRILYIQDIEESVKYSDELLELKNNYRGWDPAEFDSYEEYLDMEDELEFDENIFNDRLKEFGSREEYQDFLLRAASSRDASIDEYYMDEITDYEDGFYYDNGKVANSVVNEFYKIFETYGLWFEPGFSWSLTTYRC